MNYPPNYIPFPEAGAYITYTIGGNKIFSFVNGYVGKTEKETKTFQLVEDDNGRMCVVNLQGVVIPLKVFTKSKRIDSYYFHK